LLIEQKIALLILKKFDKIKKEANCPKHFAQQER